MLNLDVCFFIRRIYLVSRIAFLIYGNQERINAKFKKKTVSVTGIVEKHVV